MPEGGDEQIVLEAVEVAQERGRAVRRRRRRDLAGRRGADGAQPVGERRVAVVGVRLALGDLCGEDRVDLRPDLMVVEEALEAGGDRRAVAVLERVGTPAAEVERGSAVGGAPRVVALRDGAAGRAALVAWAASGGAALEPALRADR